MVRRVAHSLVALDGRPRRAPTLATDAANPHKPRVLDDGRWRGDLLFECGGRDGDRGGERQGQDRATESAAMPIVQRGSADRKLIDHRPGDARGRRYPPTSAASRV